VPRPVERVRCLARGLVHNLRRRTFPVPLSAQRRGIEHPGSSPVTSRSLCLDLGQGSLCTRVRRRVILRTSAEGVSEVRSTEDRGSASVGAVRTSTMRTRREAAITQPGSCAPRLVSARSLLLGPRFPTTWRALLLAPIHRSAWRGNSANFALRGFSEVRLAAVRRRDEPPGRSAAPRHIRTI
jgi:hypothetical protein